LAGMSLDHQFEIEPSPQPMLVALFSSRGRC
jgi:hypothetical protein